MTTTEKAQIAAEYLKSSWDGKGCVYFDDNTRTHYICENEEEMVALYDLIHSADADEARDAYSLWCTLTSHAAAAE